MKINKLLITFPVVVALVGCASMFGDNTRKVSVNSNPAGALIKIDGQNYGTTPAIITLPTYVYGGKTITLQKDGYVDTSVSINTEFQLVGLWNILNMPIGFAIDGLDGDFVKISTDSQNINTSLTKKN